MTTLRFLVQGLVLLAAAGGSLAGPPVAAQTGTATLHAVGFPGLPAIREVAVVAEEGTEINAKLQSVIVQALAARGIAVKPGAALQLVFDTEITPQTQPITDTAGPGPGLLSGDDPDPALSASEYEPLEEAETFDDEVSIPLGGGGGDSGNSAYSLSFTLGKSGEPPVWQGSISATLPTQDPLAVANGMVTPLVNTIGRSVPSSQITLP